MIYLDSAATSLQKPQSVKWAVSKAINTMASPGRGSHHPAMLAADCVYDCRERLAEYFNVSNSENVIFTFNATHALNIAIKSIVKEGDNVAITGYEHNAVVRPLNYIGANVYIASSPLFRPEAIIESFREILPYCSCAICTHVSNVFGYILPIYEISKLCEQFGVPLIIDASQSAGIIPFDFDALNVAFAAMPGHKGLLGPQGTGVLLCNHETTPLICGGTGGDSMLEFMPEYLPDRLEAGTHNVTGVAGLNEGLKFIMSKPKTTILNHESWLSSNFIAGASTIPQLKLFTSDNTECQSGVVSVICEKMSCEELSYRLGRAGICTRAGLHCAPLAHKTAGTIDTGTVRFSFSPFNNITEVDMAIRILKKIIDEA